LENGQKSRFPAELYEYGRALQEYVLPLTEIDPLIEVMPIQN
jgi:hypothetical protein